MTRIDPDTVAREIVEKWEAVIFPHEVRHLPALQSAISSTITRYAEALEVAQTTLRHRDWTGCLTIGKCDEALADIDAILSRADVPEMEQVEIERFIVFYADGSVSHVLTREGIQGFDCKGGTCKRVSHTIQRPKAKPVVKSVSVDAEISFNGFIVEGKGGLFSDFPEIKGKKVKLTVAYTEPSK